MEACLWQLGFTQLCHKVSKNDFKVTEQLSLLLNSGEVLTRICFRAELDFILIGKQHSDLSSNFLNSGGGQVFLQHHIFHISLVHVRTTFKNGHRRPCWLLRVEKIWENPFFTEKMECHTLKINTEEHSNVGSKGREMFWVISIPPSQSMYLKYIIYLWLTISCLLKDDSQMGSDNLSGFSVTLPEEI